MKNIVDYLVLNESLGGNGYVVSYRNKDMDSGQLFSFLIETDDSIEEFAKRYSRMTWLKITLLQC